MFSSKVCSYSFFCRSFKTSYRSAVIDPASSGCWLIGTAVPLILMLIGDLTDKKISEAFLSAIRWNSRFIADMGPSPWIPERRSWLIAAQQVVDARFCARLRVDLLH